MFSPCLQSSNARLRSERTLRHCAWPASDGTNGRSRTPIRMHSLWSAMGQKKKVSWDQRKSRTVDTVQFQESFTILKKKNNRTSPFWSRPLNCDWAMNEGSLVPMACLLSYLFLQHPVQDLDMLYSSLLCLQLVIQQHSYHSCEFNPALIQCQRMVATSRSCRKQQRSCSMLDSPSPVVYTGIIWNTIGI